MEDSSCNKAAPELLDSCYVWIYSMLGWNKFLSAHCVCGCLCYIPPGVTLYHETVCNYVFTRPSPLSLFVSFWFFVCVRAISPSSDPGLSGDAGPGARGVCQPPLPRRRHPESQTPLVEERHGPAAQILQTALSHRWGVFKCCRQRMRSGRYCLPHLIGAVLQTNSAAVRQHCRDLFFFFKPRQCRNNKSSKFKLVLAPFFFLFSFVIEKRLPAVLFCCAFRLFVFRAKMMKPRLRSPSSAIFILLHLRQNKHTYSSQVNEKGERADKMKYTVCQAMAATYPTSFFLKTHSQYRREGEQNGERLLLFMA